MEEEKTRKGGQNLISSLTKKKEKYREAELDAVN